MQLEYNGVNMELVTIHRVERVGVYTPDNVDLLYINWIIGATCVYSPGGLPVGTAVRTLSDHTIRESEGANAFPGNPWRGQPPKFDPVTQEVNVASGANPRKLADVGRNAAMTDLELRTRLWLPRGKLKITAARDDGQEITWMESPKPGFNVDMINGPHPISVDIVEATGEGQTFGVHFQIRTALSPCPSGADKLILSHRWEMTHAEDDDFYLTRIIEGEVVFNGAMVDKMGINPDWLREQFFHPIPVGFRRLGPIIKQSSDRLTIRYTIRDVNPHITFDPGDSGATQISIVENVGYSQNHRLF